MKRKMKRINKFFYNKILNKIENKSQLNKYLIILKYN